MLERVRPSLTAVALAAGLAACSTEPGYPVFQAALGDTLRDEALLSKLCQRPITAIEANATFATMQNKPAAAPGEISFPDFTAKRSALGKEGTGRAGVLYVPRQGAPCTGELTFAFRQETSMQRVGKRGAKYASEIALSSVTVAPK